jgi:outer membrane protein assembly factor BamD (BamD/ComL family)
MYSFGGSMRKAYGLLMIGLLAALIWGCGEKMTEEQIRAKALDFENKEQWVEAVKMYERLLKAYPQSNRAAETIYRLGITYANNLKDFNKAVATHQRLVKDYPNSNYVKQSTFMIGYIYANDLKDLEKAKSAYQEFMQKWPTHELASSVKWELDHLGQDISQIELQLGESSSVTPAKPKK